MYKVKMISETIMDTFEYKINDFIKDKDVFDIKVNIVTSTRNNNVTTTYYAMIILQ